MYASWRSVFAALRRMVACDAQILEIRSCTDGLIMKITGTVLAPEAALAFYMPLDNCLRSDKSGVSVLY